MVCVTYTTPLQRSAELNVGVSLVRGEMCWYFNLRCRTAVLKLAGSLRIAVSVCEGGGEWQRHSCYDCIASGHGLGLGGAGLTNACPSLHEGLGSPADPSAGLPVH